MRAKAPPGLCRAAFCSAPERGAAVNKKDSRRLPADELSVLCWQLSLLSRAGYPAGESVAMLAQEAPSPRAGRALRDMQQALDEGETLSCAMERAQVFDEYAVEMAGIGQVSGRLEQVLGALGDYYRRESERETALRRAVSYPAFMAALTAAVFIILVWQVLPVFQRVFEQLGGSVAAGGLAVFGPVGRGLTAAIAAGLIALAAYAGICLARGVMPFARLFDSSSAGRAAMRGRFSSAMALMLSSGLPVDEALSRSARLLRATPAEAAAQECLRRVEQGEALAAAVENSGLLTGLQAGLLSSGVRAGSADAAMREIALRCREESEAGTQRLLRRFEYALVMLLCVVVGALLLSVMLPLLGILAAMGG